MRQTTDHQSYAGSVGVSLSHGLSPASRSPDHRSGFTLIEVVVAMSIMLVVAVSLIASYSAYYGGIVQMRVSTLAQNLAQLQMEDMASKDKSVLAQMVLGTNIGDVNYPVSSVSGIYDSGKLPGTFTIPNVASVNVPSLGITNHSPSGASDVPNLDLPAGTVDVEPVYHAATSYWDYTVTIDKGAFPGYQRRVVTTDKSSSNPP